VPLRNAMAALVFSLKPNHGMTRISLYKRVPKTSMMNPGISRGIKGSWKIKQLKIQIVSVREVSIVERCAAEAYLVQATPQALNKAIHMVKLIM